MAQRTRSRYDLCACGNRKTVVSSQCWDCHCVGRVLLERLMDIRTDRCVEWPRHLDKVTGYGRLSFQGRKQTAHRAAWVLAHGEIAPGLHVLHRCDNRPCVNLRHLFLGSNGDNVADMMAKGRQARGEARHNSRLIASQVVEIRRLVGAGSRPDQVAATFGVARQTVNDIVWGRTWTHV